MSFIRDAQNGQITEEMKTVAKVEGVEPEFVRKGVASGRIVIPVSPYRETMSCGVGKGMRTKVNATVGTSSDIVDIDLEVRKTKVAEKAGADTLMELSTGGDLVEVRKRVIAATSLSVGSVPLYQAFIEAIERNGAVVDMNPDDLFRITAEQAKLGTNFMAWMLHNEKENPLYSEFDYLLEIMLEHEVTLSMGNGMRAGAVHDATDRAGVQELIMHAELGDRAYDAGVQVIVEGPGHVPIDEIETNIKLMKSMTKPGYDHIVTAIGGAISSSCGADFLCYVTPAEHLALPNEEDVYEGVMASRIAAHVGDMIKYGDRARAWDLDMARARRDLDWNRQYELAIDEDRAREIRNSRLPGDTEACTMCGDFCALKIVKENFNFDK